MRVIKHEERNAHPSTKLSSVGLAASELISLSTAAGSLGAEKFVISTDTSSESSGASKETSGGSQISSACDDECNSMSMSGSSTSAYASRVKATEESMRKLQSLVLNKDEEPADALLLSVGQFISGDAECAPEFDAYPFTVITKRSDASGNAGWLYGCEIQDHAWIKSILKEIDTKGCLDGRNILRNSERLLLFSYVHRDNIRVISDGDQVRLAEKTRAVIIDFDWLQKVGQVGSLQALLNPGQVSVMKKIVDTLLHPFKGSRYVQVSVPLQTAYDAGAAVDIEMTANKDMTIDTQSLIKLELEGTPAVLDEEELDNISQWISVMPSNEKATVGRKRLTNIGPFAKSMGPINIQATNEEVSHILACTEREHELSRYQEGKKTHLHT